MSIARLPSTEAAVIGLSERAASESDLRLDIHDASRIEWSVSLPLPEGRPCAYSIAVEMEIPSNALARHMPWDQLQSFTLLDGGEAFRLDEDIVTIDSLRRNTVAVTSRMARVGEEF